MEGDGDPQDAAGGDAGDHTLGGGGSAGGAGGEGETQHWGPRQRPGLGLLVRAGHLEYDRVLFFSDAIFAIAITLLVVEIRVPGVEEAGHQLRSALPNIYSFAISFAVIGLFWMGHHSLFRYIVVLDRPLITINLAFLGTIAFLPYPTALLGQGHGGPSAVAVIFYSACMAAAGLGELMIWVYAANVKDLLTPGTSRATRRYLTLRLIRVPAVFLVAIPVALLSPSLGAYCWILIAPAGILTNRYARPAGDDAKLAI
jgi:TMEM175 potassium channel family protein